MLQPIATQPAMPWTPARLLPFAAVLVVAVAIVALLVFVVRSCTSGSSGSSPDEGASSEAVVVEDTRPRVSLVAVGDNLPNDVLADYADAQSGSKDDGKYDYRSLFSQVKPYVESADLAYIDQETHVGGHELGAHGYPSFNTTDEMADAVVDAGFNLVASATNHSYDWGPYGAIEHSRGVWNQLPVAFTGTATTYDEAADIPVVERNGMKFALLSYTYGLNGYAKGDIPDYYVNCYDEERLTEDVGRAHELADVVMVAMHWGEENNSVPTDEEKRYAQLLADLGVDVVLGSHPHIIQPMTWLRGKQGKETLVCYSLGNFIMQYNDPEPEPYGILEGMMSCDFVKSDDGAISIENVKWTPLVYHGESGNYAVWALKDYSESLASRNPCFVENSDSDYLKWMREESERIVNSMGNSFEVDA